MRGRFVVVGTNHPLQFGAPDCPSEKVEAFREFVANVCLAQAIRLIAEEATQEALQKFSVMETVAGKLAKDKGLKYEMVDLSLNERISLGISDAQLSAATFNLKLKSQFNLQPLRNRLNNISDQVREGTWVARTLRAATWPALLIIGATHVRKVEKLVRSLRQELVIARADYEP